MLFDESYRIGIYEKALSEHLTWEERLSAAKEAGYDYLELSIDETEKRMSRLEWNDDQVQELAEI